LSEYGVNEVISYEDPTLSAFKAHEYGVHLASTAKEMNVDLVVLSSSADAKYLAPILSVALMAGYASNVVALPESYAPLTVKRTCYSNKAFNTTILKNEINIIGLSNNAFGAHKKSTPLSVKSGEISPSSGSLQIEKVEKVTGKVTIADADIVISGGRGLKGPENWHLIEDLADVLGAATACSKPVSDMGWRPHSEHVGQTGKPVATNLYIAEGVSGAIQHLAGINASKVKVVINNDPEAPFFKAADYGVVGDAFEVVPALIEKLKKFQNS
jgi:electron transfer flavoprotein alpha subunit